MEKIEEDKETKIKDEACGWDCSSLVVVLKKYFIKNIFNYN